MDHGQEMLDRLLAQFEGKPRMEGLVRVLGNRLNKCEAVLIDMQEKRSIDTALGVQLDGCGVIVDQARLIDKAIALPFFGFRGQPNGRGFGKARFRQQGESARSSATLGDAEFRKIIKAKIAKNVSWGNAEEVISSFQAIFKAPRVIVSETGSATIRVGICRELNEAERILAQAMNLFVKPGGIGIQVKAHFNPASTFGFQEQGLQGFGAGKFAKNF